VWGLRLPHAFTPAGWFAGGVLLPFAGWVADLLKAGAAPWRRMQRTAPHAAAEGGHSAAM